MATLQNSCSACYKTSAPECVESYLIGGLTPGVTYHVVATDSRGIKYVVDNDEPCDVDGNITLVFPVDMNSAEIGTLTLQVFNLDIVTSGSGLLCNPETLTTCEGDFTCIELSFYKHSFDIGTGEGSIWQLLCLCPEDAVCDGMCSVPENGIDATEFLGIIDDVGGLTGADSGKGFYLIHDAKAFVLVLEGKIAEIYTCCNGIIGYYVGTEGPHQFSEDTESWEPMFTYQATSWNFGVEVFFSGSIPEFATAAFQVSTDSGATWGTLKSGITSAKLAAEDSVNTALTSFKSRLLVTMPDGCSYPSAISTLTE